MFIQHFLLSKIQLSCNKTKQIDIEYLQAKRIDWMKPDQVLYDHKL